MAFVLANQVRFQWGDAALLALANTDWSGMRLRRRIEAAALAVVLPVLLWTLPVSSVVTFGELRCVARGVTGARVTAVACDTIRAPICFASLVACRRATVAGLCISSRVVMFQRQRFFWRTERHFTTPLCWFSPIQQPFIFYFVYLSIYSMCVLCCASCSVVAVCVLRACVCMRACVAHHHAATSATPLPASRRAHGSLRRTWRTACRRPPPSRRCGLRGPCAGP